MIENPNVLTGYVFSFKYMFHTKPEGWLSMWVILESAFKFCPSYIGFLFFLKCFVTLQAFMRIVYVLSVYFCSIMLLLGCCYGSFIRWTSERRGWRKLRTFFYLKRWSWLCLSRLRGYWKRNWEYIWVPI